MDLDRWLMNTVNIGPQKIVAVGLNGKTELFPCPVSLLKNHCPTFTEAIRSHPVELAGPFHVFATPEAYDAAMRWILGDSIEDLRLDENQTVDLFNFTWQHHIKNLNELSKDSCLMLDFDRIQASCLIKLHYHFFYHNIWFSRPDRENDLFRAISQRGTEVMAALSATTAPCLDTVIRILKQPSLNIFSEKEVYDAINIWHKGVNLNYKNLPWNRQRFGSFYTRLEAEVFPLIRCDFFTINEVDDILDRVPYFAIKRTVADDPVEKNYQAPMLTRLQKEFSPEGGLNLQYLSEWRGNFYPFTERSIFLKGTTSDRRPEEDNDQTFAIRPLKKDIYLLHVRLFNLADQSHGFNLVPFMIKVIRVGDNATVSKTFSNWYQGESHQIRLLNPCLLVKNQTYKITITNLVAENQFQNYFDVGYVCQDYKDELWVTGKGNICAFKFAFAKKDV